MTHPSRAQNPSNTSTLTTLVPNSLSNPKSFNYINKILGGKRKKKSEKSAWKYVKITTAEFLTQLFPFEFVSHASTSPNCRLKIYGTVACLLLEG